MFQQSSYTEQLTFFQKLRSFDFILVLCVLILGLVSNLSMFSTDGGEFLYHTKKRDNLDNLGEIPWEIIET